MTKELTELDLPPHAIVKFDKENIMSISVEVNLKKEDCLWQGGIYKFSVEVGPGYPHDAPKVKCAT